MTKKYQSRATKIVLASLLAISLVAPANYAFANDATPTQVQSTDQSTAYTLSAERGMDHFSSVKVIIKDGQYYADMIIAEKSNSLIKAITTEQEGKQVPVNVLSEQPTRHIQFPIATDAKFVNANVIVALPNGTEMSQDFTFTVVDTKEEVISTAIVDMGKGMSDHFTGAKVIRKNGAYYADMTIVEKSNPMIAVLTTEREGKQVAVDVVTGERESGTRHIQFPVTLNSTLAGHVVVATPRGEMKHDFVIAIKNEEAQTTVTDKKLAKVFKEDGKTISYMAQYVVPTALVTKTTSGYQVEVELTGKEMIKNLAVADTAAKITNETATSRTYQFTTSTLANVAAEIHVVVDSAGVKYDTKHAINFVFVTPFTDMLGTEHEAAVKNLNEAGIVATAEKFNPSTGINRGQFALMLARTLGMPTTVKDAGFTDIQAIKTQDAERYKAINYLAEIGVIKSGKGFEKYNATSTLTRQQSAVMIYRAMNHAAGKELDYGAVLDGFIDQAKVQDKEAQKAFALLNQGKILTGVKAADGQLYLNPSKNLTRGQMAKILNNSLKYFSMGK